MFGWKSYFEFGKRKKIYNLLKELTQDMDLFSKSFDDKVKKHSKLKKSDLLRDRRLLYDMLRIDLSMITVVTHLYKQHRLSFEAGKQKEKYIELMKHCKELMTHHKESEQEISNLIGEAREQGGALSWYVTTHVSELTRAIADLEDIERKDINQLMLGEKNLQVHYSKLERVGDDDFYVLIDKHTYYVYHHDIHVMTGDISIRHGIPEQSLVAHADVSFCGYMERAIVMMLKKHRFREWVLSGTRSPQSDRLVERLRDNHDLILSGSEYEIHIRLR